MPRASVPLVGAVVLVGLTVSLAVVVTVTATGFAPPESSDRVVIEASAAADTGRVTLEHTGGRPLDVRRLALRVEIDGEPLAHQPPVPYYAASGFNGFPTGPFNPAADPTWSAGEAPAFRIAATNDPSLQPGATLAVVITEDGRLVARATTTVE